MRVACVGARDLKDDQIKICEDLGMWLVSNGHVIHSGNALGADQAYARGANSVRPKYVYLELPWKHYEERAIHPDNSIMSIEEHSKEAQDHYLGLACANHPAWERLGPGAQKLMMRNIAILQPFYDFALEGSVSVDVVIAFPGNRPGGGGTGHTMRVANYFGIRVVDISKFDKDQLFDLAEEFRS